MTVLLCTILIGAVNILWSGFVTSVLWGWFIVPLGIQPVTFLHAAGIGCVLAAFLGVRGLNLERTKGLSTRDAITMGFAAALTIPAMLLLFGWVIHLLML
mgnify:CR=1 FL=1